MDDVDVSEENDDEEDDDDDSYNRGGTDHNINNNTTNITTARRMRHLLEQFPNLRSLRLAGLKLTYQSLVRGRNGSSTSPRYICSLLQEAECSENLECLELVNVCESQHENENIESDASVAANMNQHYNIQLKQLRKLTITLGYIRYESEHRDYPLVHSLLRSSHHITHLNLSGCSSFDDYHLEQSIIKPLNNTLIHLNLSRSGIRMPRIESAILKSLILQQCTTFIGLHSESFIPMLEVLDLSSCITYQGSGFINNGESGLRDICPRLRKLNLRNCTALRFVTIDFSSPSTNYPNTAGTDETMASLEYIDLSRCVNLASAKISCCQLKSIDLGECMHIEVLGIKSSLIRTLNLSKLGALQLVSLHCSSLVHLNLSGCANLDSKRSIIKCNALESVDIRQAIYITPHFFTGTNKNVSIQM